MRKGIGIGVIVLVLGAAAAWALTRTRAVATDEFRFVEVQRGDVEKVITGTGRLQAITTVEVGTQVSGQLSEILVDFNDRVTKGQLIARIDPTLLEQEVRASAASVERVAAEVTQARRELTRSQGLYDKQLLSEAEYNTAVSAVEVAEASLKSAKVNLERAKRNLAYADIRAPIDGVVLSRSVDVGQTVAASFSAPQLFLIAENLAQMEILAAIDESDIGAVHTGLPARFSVQAYPDEKFQGNVDEIRLQPTTQDNVVNYTVVVSVSNPDGKLLPGMTATVEFVVAKATDVLKVSSTALRFRPTDEMRAALRGERQAAGNTRGDSARATRPSGRGQGSGAGATDRALLWSVGPGGKVNATRVKVGVSDGQFTEISGEGIEEGMSIIVGTTGTTTATSSSPFQNQSQPRRFGPPGM
jgi:HlyD family secretion protein